MVSFKSKATGLLLVAALFSSSVYSMHIQETDRGTVTLNEEALLMPAPNKQHFFSEKADKLSLLGFLSLTALVYGTDLRGSSLSPFSNGPIFHKVVGMLAGITGGIAGGIFGGILGNFLDRDARAKHEKEKAEYYKQTRGYNIFWAAAKDFVSALETHIKAGACPFAPDSKGRTPLMYAAAHGSAGTATRLLKYAKNSNAINLQDNNGNTAVLLAAKAKQPNMVKFLMRNGANGNIADKDGITVKSLIESNYLSGITLNDLARAQDEYYQAYVFEQTSQGSRMIPKNGRTHVLNFTKEELIGKQEPATLSLKQRNQLAQYNCVQQDSKRGAENTPSLAPVVATYDVTAVQ